MAHRSTITFGADYFNAQGQRAVPVDTYESWHGENMTTVIEARVYPGNEFVVTSIGRFLSEWKRADDDSRQNRAGRP